MSEQLSKMSYNHPFMCLAGSCEEAVAWGTRQMSNAGLSVLRTFDLQIARLSRADCLCPQMEVTQCDCQLMVLLVYAADEEPISLFAHGRAGKTWFSVMDSPQQHASSNLLGIIQQALVSHQAPEPDEP